MDTLVEESVKAGGGNVLVVSSGGQTPLILKMLVGDQYDGEGIENCSVTTVKYKNDTSYLE